MNLLVRAWHAPQEKSDVHAVRSMLGTIRRVIEKLSPHVLLFAAEGGHDFRRNLYPDYKATRDETPAELKAQIQLAHDAFEAIGWQVLSAPGYEADDVIATVASQCQSMELGCTIVSTDKDLQALAGSVTIYDPYKDRSIDAAAVQERFGVGPGQLLDLLALAGDKSDNVPGIPGIGEKTAAALLAEHGSLEGVLTAAVFRKSHVSKRWTAIYEHREDALLSRRLVELQKDAPLTEEWMTRPALHPRSTWYDRLREMGLGMTVKGLSDVLKEPRTSDTFRQPAISTTGEANHGSEGDGATQSDSHAADSRRGSDSTDLAVPGVCEAEDSVSPRQRPDGEQRGTPAEGTVQRDRSADPDDAGDRPAWISDCVRAGFELITHEPHPITGNFQAMRSGRKYILHTSCETITDMATVDSFTLKKFLEAVSAA